MKRYISDYHIGHTGIIELDSRPFLSLKEMHDTIIHNWNDVVSRNDEVYVLGDFALDNAAGIEVLRQLKGQKHLILGNHDRIDSELSKYFVCINDMEIIKDNNRHVVLCHYPIAHWKKADYGYVHLYGHVHAGRDSDAFEYYMEKMKKRNIPYNCFNVGCMKPYMNYTPRTLQEILDANKKVNNPPVKQKSPNTNY